MERITLIMNDRVKGPIVSYYRPITCLPLLWKVFAGVITDEIYSHLERSNLLPPERKMYTKIQGNKRSTTY